MCISYDIGVIDEVSDVCVPLSDTAASLLCSRRGGRKTGALYISNLVQKTGNHRKANEVLNSTRAHTIINHTMQTKAQSIHVNQWHNALSFALPASCKPTL